MTEKFEPTIIGFTCNWCSYRAADLAGTARMKYAPNVRLIRMMCSGRLDPTFVLRALSSGADGVMITGCHPGDCHYMEQNYKALRRYLLLKRVLAGMGIEPGASSWFGRAQPKGRGLPARQRSSWKRSANLVHSTGESRLRNWKTCRKKSHILRRCQHDCKWKQTKICHVLGGLLRRL